MRRTATKSSQIAEATRIVYSSGKDVALSVVMSSNAANTSNRAAIVTTASLRRRRLAALLPVGISRPMLVTSSCQLPSQFEDHDNARIILYLKRRPGSRLAEKSAPY